MTKKGSVLPVILVVVIITSFAALVLFVVNLNKRKQNIISGPENKEVQKALVYPSTENLKQDEPLVPYVPNFENLKIEDLPSASDIRGVFDYGNNKLIIAYNKIIEWDPIKNDYVRQSDTNIIKNINYGVVMGDFLYYTVELPEYKDNWPGKRVLVKIDLAQNKIIKTYFKESVSRYANLKVIKYRDTIWASSWDGVFTFNPTTEEIRNYPNVELDCRADIYTSHSELRAQCTYGTKTYTYSDSKDQWFIGKNSAKDYSDAINLTIKDYKLNLPTYQFISYKNNDKYYLFSDLGVYTLKKGDFPKIFSKLTPNGYTGFTLALVTKNEKYALTLGHEIFGGGLFAELFDFEDNKVLDLIKGNTSYESLNQNDQNNFAEKIQKALLVEEANKINILDEQGKTIATLYLDDKTLRIL